MEKALEILKAQDATLEEVLRVGKTIELLSRGLVVLLEKTKGGVSSAEYILKREQAGDEGNDL